MALNSGNLEADLRSAFQSGMDGASSDEVASQITDAIVSYASGASILMVPLPIPIPGTPSPSSQIGSTLNIATHETGRATLLSGIQGQFSSQDATMMTMAAAIQTYVNTSFTLFNAVIGNMAAGVTAMPAPPALSSVPPAGLGGASADQIAAQMAPLIHTAFLASTFTSPSGVAIDGGSGPVFGPLM